jgi:hypothetical protein
VAQSVAATTAANAPGGGGFGGAAAPVDPTNPTARVVQHEGEAPLPTTDAQGNPVAPGTVRHDLPGGFYGADAGQPGAGTAAAPHQGGFGGLLGNIVHGVEGLGGGLAHLAGYKGQGQGWDMDKLIPFLTGVADFVGAPTKYPLVAATQGLAGWGQAYMGQQQKEAQIAQEQASAFQTRQAAIAPNLAKVGNLLDGPADPKTGAQTVMIGGKPYHYATADELMGGPPTQTAAPGLATPATQAGASSPAVGIAPATGGGGGSSDAITAHYDTGTYDIGPTSGQDAEMAKAGFAPIAPGDRGGGIRAQVHLSTQPQLQQQAESDHAFAKAQEGDVIQLNNLHRQQLDMAGAISSLPEGGLLASGPGAGAKYNALNWANQVLRTAGLPPLQGITDATNAQQVLGKLNGVLAQVTSQQYGQTAAAEAEQIRSILPGVETSKGAAMNLLSQMMVSTQQSRDFGEYHHAYQQRYGTDYGIQQAYSRDMQPRYDSETRNLARAMMRGSKGGPSAMEALMANPKLRQAFEQGTDYQGKHHEGFGNGMARYFIGGQ